MFALRLIIIVIITMAIRDSTSERTIFCYFSSWSVWRTGNGKVTIETDIDPSLCTHLVYAFAGLDGVKMKSLDPWGDLPDGGGLDGYNRFNKLRERYPMLKTLIAIGGWQEGSEKYSQMAMNAKNREEFAANAVDFVRKHKFDGLDIDWEYPAQRGGAKEDVQNFIELLKVLRIYFNKFNLILSAAVAAPESSASKSYRIKEMSQYLNFINIMTYDYHVGDAPKTDLQAPLYPEFNGNGTEDKLNIEDSVKYWLTHGCPKEKILLGIPFYGRTFTLCNPRDNEIGAAACGPGKAGKYSCEPGMMGYNEICEEFRMDSTWKECYNEKRGSAYAFSGLNWISFDNVQSISQKAEFIKKLDLGGAMVWSIDTDDFKGICGRKNPLLHTLNEVLYNK